jgi:four helix bundle protein
VKFKYEGLEIWQLAIDYVAQYYRLMAKLPEQERFGLVSQGRRAAVSIALNIAEGSGRKTDRDFSLFVNRAMTSLMETDAVAKIAMRLGYFSESDYALIEPLMKTEYYKLVAFDKALQSKANRRRRYSDG